MTAGFLIPHTLSLIFSLMWHLLWASKPQATFFGWQKHRAEVTEVRQTICCTWFSIPTTQHSFIMTNAGISKIEVSIKWGGGSGKKKDQVLHFCTWPSGLGSLRTRWENVWLPWRRGSLERVGVSMNSIYLQVSYCSGCAGHIFYVAGVWQGGIWEINEWEVQCISCVQYYLDSCLEAYNDTLQCNTLWFFVPPWSMQF